MTAVDVSVCSVLALIKRTSLLFFSKVGVTSPKTMKLLPVVGRKATQKVIFKNIRE